MLALASMRRDDICVDACSWELKLQVDKRTNKQVNIAV